MFIEKMLVLSFILFFAFVGLSVLIEDLRRAKYLTWYEILVSLIVFFVAGNICIYLAYIAF